MTEKKVRSRHFGNRCPDPTALTSGLSLKYIASPPQHFIPLYTSESHLITSQFSNCSWLSFSNCLSSVLHYKSALGKINTMWALSHPQLDLCFLSNIVKGIRRYLRPPLILIGANSRRFRNTTPIWIWSRDYGQRGMRGCRMMCSLQALCLFWCTKLSISGALCLGFSLTVWGCSKTSKFKM